MPKKIIIILGIIVLSGLSAIFFDRYFFPYFSTTKLFSQYDFLKKSVQDVTVINKTEQIYVKEDSSVTKIANQSASSVVNIISYPITKSSISEVKNGTGVIATSDGFIMTYGSSILPKDARYKVLVSNGNSYDAELSAIDSFSNLAFLKISASNLPAVSFANSDDTNPGEKVIAVGNGTDEFQNEFALGLISSFDKTFNLSGKTVSSSEKMEGIFKTDIAFQKDFLGGLVVDYAGQTVGIIGAVTIDNQNEYFAIPSNKVKVILEKAIKKELDQNPALGLYYVPLNKTFNLVNGIQQENGAIVYSPSGQNGLAIIADSPAAKAGVKIGDIIIKINDQEINSQNTLSDTLFKFKKGDKIELSIIRNSTEIKVPVQL